MTLSIIGRDARSGALGIAIASRFLAVGAICPFVFPGLGALSTQALGHPPFGAAARTLLAQGLAPAEIVAALVEADADRARRQIHLVDASGRAAAFDGAEILDASGHRAGPDISVAGNMLAGPAVLDAALDAWQAHPGLPLADRLLAALAAGHGAGGDRRGQQAASLLVHGAQPFPLLSLRVDDDEAAVDGLIALRASAAADYIPYMRRFASAAEIDGVFGP